MKKEISCGAVIARQTENGREILLIRHVNGGHWAFPKGHMEGNETESETALREIREETGLTVTLDTGFRAVVTYSPKPGVMKDVIYFAAGIHRRRSAPAGRGSHASSAGYRQKKLRRTSRLKTIKMC